MKIYNEPEIKVISLDMADILTESDPGSEDGFD